MDKAALKELFSYHAPKPDQIPRYEAIRKAAYEFALVIAENTTSSPDQSAAIRKLRECVMTANASIALEDVSDGLPKRVEIYTPATIVDPGV